jgi:hypothetical protein
MTATEYALDTLVRHYLVLRQEAQDWAKARDEAAEAVLGAMAAGESYETEPGVGVRVQAPSRRFDPALARQLLPPDLYASICVSVPDVKLAEARLPGDLVDQCRRQTGRPSLRVL